MKNKILMLGLILSSQVYAMQIGDYSIVEVKLMNGNRLKDHYIIDSEVVEYDAVADIAIISELISDPNGRHPEEELYKAPNIQKSLDLLKAGTLSACQMIAQNWKLKVPLTLAEVKLKNGAVLPTCKGVDVFPPDIEKETAYLGSVIGYHVKIETQYKNGDLEFRELIESSTRTSAVVNPMRARLRK